jgi:hypothetical protein
VYGKLFRPNRDEVTGGWKKLHNQELHNSNSSKIIIIMIKSKEDEMYGACSTHGGDEKCIALFGKLEGKRPLRRSGHTCE